MSQSNYTMYPLADNGGYTSDNDGNGDALANMATETEVMTVEPKSNLLFWLVVLALVGWLVWGNK